MISIPSACEINYNKEYKQLSITEGFPGGTDGKESACQCRTHTKCRFDPWVWKIPWRRKWQPTPVFLPGKSHRERNLVGYSPWGRKESDTTERLTLPLLLQASRKHNKLFISTLCWCMNSVCDTASPVHSSHSRLKEQERSFLLILLSLVKETWPSFPSPSANCHDWYYQPTHHSGWAETSSYLKATALWISKFKPRWHIPFYNFPTGTNSGWDTIHQNRHWWLNFGRLGEELSLSWKTHATGSQVHQSLVTWNQMCFEWRNGP